MLSTLKTRGHYRPPILLINSLGMKSSTLNKELAEHGRMLALLSHFGAMLGFLTIALFEVHIHGSLPNMKVSKKLSSIIVVESRASDNLLFELHYEIVNPFME